MNTPAVTRTNPAYAYLAYRKAIVGHVVAMLVKDCTSALGEPEQHISSEDVFRDEAEVPEREIHQFINELQQQEESLRLEMLKFDFVKREGTASGEERQQGPTQGQPAPAPVKTGSKPKGRPRKSDGITVGAQACGPPASFCTHTGSQWYNLLHPPG